MQKDKKELDESQDYTKVETLSENSETSKDSESETNSVKSNYCSICLETEELNIRYIKFPCQHIFHVHCFEEYFQYKISHKPSEAHIECPICRTTFSTNTLRSVFNISHENPDENITILIPNTDDNMRVATNTTQVRGCTTADVVVIFLLLLGLTLYLLALDNVI